MRLRVVSNFYTPTLGVFLIFLISIIWLVGVAYAEPANQTIREGLSGTQIDSITKTPINGIYEVKAGNNIFYSNNSGRYLLFGHLYDASTQTDLTTNSDDSPSVASTQTPSNISWSSLPHDAA
ncbi:MAG: disulfide isomerase DsbC N-terminal domain-containing protein, partial [Gammaproteobacteria bacterium]